MSARVRCWLMKSGPAVYSIDDLARDRITSWAGVRNYQARILRIRADFRLLRLGAIC